MIAATPEALLATQAHTIERIRASSPLLPSEFEALIKGRRSSTVAVGAP